MSGFILYTINHNIGVLLLFIYVLLVYLKESKSKIAIFSNTRGVLYHVVLIPLLLLAIYQSYGKFRSSWYDLDVVFYSILMIFIVFLFIYEKRNKEAFFSQIKVTTLHKILFISLVIGVIVITFICFNQIDTVIY